MATQPIKGVLRQVKPLISTDSEEARKRVIKLYKAWYRLLPSIIVEHHLPITLGSAREKLKNEFIKHKNVRDIRVIDLLVVKGEMHFKETTSRWKQKCHIMYMLKDTQIPTPSSFLGKFFSGPD